ncbi:thiamine pyrophosphate-dependent dehydrogenase E1 component subunit alpha [Nonomuraea sp. MG754425]|uniref:thiamine pyrophosphate-dependent dehydrogenase E1 component subunit alpha n=1 Tax=Nonomuraea sp. MG754425 TaxID=2570319 RepID=UPI001F194D34|nr:thiamine pyrophosphate-dependent dehydrogenase E1 component subunit alpha [Nonomuraea sp. MG754425]MCF6472394.1 thiamine pyrophosphate-dependent dehydrogenase E1 component subunit alpha [Nonomuraea sp. MG754425]
MGAVEPEAGVARTFESRRAFRGAGCSPARAFSVSEHDLERLLLIRHFENKLLELFEQGRLHGTTHTCLGQEYIPVALGALLKAGDHVFSNHRGHGHYLARFDDPDGLLAEIMGRSGAVCGGVGGSQHILRDRFLSTGVQGESLPVAAGVALHLKRRSPGEVALVHIGDGTWGQGVVYETLNIARLWSLPLLVVVENNKIAQSTEVSAHMAGTIADRAAAFDIGYHFCDSILPDVIRAELGPLVRKVRETPMPLIVEFDTYRVGPHSKGDDTRDRVALRRAADHDWYVRFRQAMPERFGAVDRRQRTRVAAVADAVAARPLSGGSNAF